MTEMPLSALGTSLPWFREQLQLLGISIPRFGSLDLGLERLGVLRDMEGKPFTFPKGPAEYEFFSQALGIDFLTKTLHRGVTSGLLIDSSRWHHLVTDDPFITSKGQAGDGRNRLWETVLACTVSTFATNVRFEEPDVLCEFSSSTFAVAAKFVHSDRQIGKNVRKGIDQALGRAPAAIVAANVVDLLPLHELYESTAEAPPESPAAVVDRLREWATQWCEKQTLTDLVKDLRGAHPSIVGVAFFMPFLIKWRGSPMPFYYTHMPLTWSGEKSVDFQFTKSFLHASQAATGFRGDAV